MRRTRWLVAGALAVVLAGFGVAAFGFGGSSKNENGAAPAARPTATSTARARPPAPRIVSGPHDAPIPILMYHVVAAPVAGAPNAELFVSRDDFAGQMQWLAAHGYHAVTLRRAYDYWAHAYALPPKPVVVSFDDGYLSQYTTAMPVLRSHRWPGVLNLEVNNLRPGDLTPAQVRGLIRAGWEIDAHTITHPDLRAVGDAQLQMETAGARARIHALFGVPVSFFCYPAGKYDDRVVAAVRAAGYLAATTVNFGLAAPGDGMFTLDRVRIDGSDGVAGFASKLSRLG